MYEICTLLGFYAAQNGSFLPTFRGKLLVPSSRPFGAEIGPYGVIAKCSLCTRTNFSLSFPFLLFSFIACNCARGGI